MNEILFSFFNQLLSCEKPLFRGKKKLQLHLTITNNETNKN